jgi:cytoskeletal protein RodZ
MAAVASPADSFHPVPDLPDIGAALRDARHTRHLTVAEAAEATNVRDSYLEALENDDSLDAFPAPVYARFFLREYARFLGLDEAPLLQAQEAQGGTRDPSIEVPSPAVPPPKRWGARVLAVAAVAGLVTVAATSLWPHHAARTGTPPAPSAGRSSAPPPSKPTTAPAKPHAIQAVLTFSARCWVQATVDGKVKAQQTYSPGASLRLQGHALLLRLGYPSGANLRINGRHIPTGGSSASTLSFVWRNGQVVRTG